MMEFSFIMEARMKVRAFLSDSSNKNFLRKKLHGVLMKKAAATLRCSEKQVLPKRIKKQPSRGVL